MYAVSAVAACGLLLDNDMMEAFAAAAEASPPVSATAKWNVQNVEGLSAGILDMRKKDACRLDRPWTSTTSW